MFARAAYAAADAEVLPVEAHITAFEPLSAALEIAIVIPRSLNEPVGLAPSHLKNISASIFKCSARFLACTSGVSPSFKLIIECSGTAGRNSRYFFINPVFNLPPFFLSD